MILISNRGLAIFYLLSLGFLLGCGIYGYTQLNIELSTGSAKLAAERLLYTSIVGSIFISAFLGHVYLQRVRLEKKIRRLATLGGTAAPLRQLRSGQFGSFGRSLEILYRRIMEVNEQQAIKLSGQSDLISLLLTDAGAPIAVTDITGKILYTSEKYEKRLDMTRSKLIGSSIETVETDIFMPVILEQIESRRTYSSSEEVKSEQKSKSSYTVLPIFDKRGEICYLLFDFSVISPFGSNKSRRSPHSAATTEKTGKVQEKRHNPLRWLSQRIAKKDSTD